jgi:hypothetical protein
MMMMMSIMTIISKTNDEECKYTHESAEYLLTILFHSYQTCFTDTTGAEHAYNMFGHDRDQYLFANNSFS